MASRVTGVERTVNNIRRAGQLPKGPALDADMRAALEPMRDAINTRAPRRILKGAARSALLQGFSATKRRWWIAFVEPGRRIAHLVELGTAPHSMHKGSSRRKGIGQDLPPHHPGDPAHPFMRPAFEETKEQVVLSLSRAIMARLRAAFGGSK